MRKWIIILPIIILIVLLWATPVLAVDPDYEVVTIYATPGASGGITGFTITYISDTQLDLNWGFAGDAINVMIRAKYGAYPANIPDIFTEPSDGYLVYSGNATSVSDTSMNFDQNPGILYYVAWAQKADGTWFTDIHTGWKESKEVILIALILLCAVVSYFSLRSSNILLGLGASLTWILLLVYTRSNPIGGVATGSFADELVVYICWIFAVLLPFMAMFRGRRERQYFGRGGGSVEWGETRKIEPNPSPLQNRGLMERSNGEYRDHVRKALHPHQRRP